MTPEMLLAIKLGEVGGDPQFKNMSTDKLASIVKEALGGGTLVSKAVKGIAAHPNLANGAMGAAGGAAIGAITAPKGERAKGALTGAAIGGVGGVAAKAVAGAARGGLKSPMPLKPATRRAAAAAAVHTPAQGGRVGNTFTVPPMQGGPAPAAAAAARPAAGPMTMPTTMPPTTPAPPTGNFGYRTGNTVPMHAPVPPAPNMQGMRTGNTVTIPPAQAAAAHLQAQQAVQRSRAAAGPRIPASQAQISIPPSRPALPPKTAAVKLAVGLIGSVQPKPPPVPGRMGTPQPHATPTGGQTVTQAPLAQPSMSTPPPQPPAALNGGAGPQPAMTPVQGNGAFHPLSTSPAPHQMRPIPVYTHATHSTLAQRMPTPAPGTPESQQAAEGSPANKKKSDSSKSEKKDSKSKVEINIK